MRILFLDIDGVLNSRRWFVERQDKSHGGLAHLDPEACARLDRLCAETGADIVVSSTWRLLHKLPALRRMLRARGVRAKVLGVTPDHRAGPKRGDQIQAWLDANSGGPGAGGVGRGGICILDDDSDMVHLSPWHVKTHFERGLTDWEVRKAKDVLGMKPPRRSV